MTIKTFSWVSGALSGAGEYVSNWAVSNRQYVTSEVCRAAGWGERERERPTTL